MKESAANPLASTGRLRKLAIAAALALFTFALYYPVLQHEFVDFDDPVYILENPSLAEGLSVETVVRAFAEPYETNWIPLTWISLMLDHACFGFEPSGYHLVNAALHAFATALLFLVLTALTGSPAPSAFVAAVFAAHPLHVESVAWAAERKDTLSGVFWMLTLAAYTRYVRRSRSIGSYALVLVSLLAGLLAKPILVTLPLVLLLLDFWPLQRLRPGAAASRSSRSPAAAAIIEKLPLLAVCGAIAAVTFLVQEAAGAMPHTDDLSFRVRLINALESYWIYIFDSVRPSDLAIFYPHPASSSSPGVAAAAAAGLIALTALFASAARTRPYLIVGWLWYLVTLLPVIGLVQVGMQGHADRYTYIPQIGLTISLAWGARDSFGRTRVGRGALLIAGFAVICALAYGTRGQLDHWRNSTALYERAIAVTEDNFIAHHGLAVQLLTSGDAAAAERHFARAAEIKPRWASAHIGLGDALLEQQQFEAAIDGYRRAVALAPRDPDAHAHLAQGLMRNGEFEAAIESYRRAIELFGENSPAQIHAHLAAALTRSQQLGKARHQYRAALSRQPRFAAAHANFGILLLRMNQPIDARLHLEYSLELGLESAETHAALAALKDRLGDGRGAVRHYRAALRLRPGWSRTSHSLAWLLASHSDPSVREPAAAIALAESQLSGSVPADPETLDVLAAAYAADGRFAAAEESARAAVAIAQGMGRPELASRIIGRLSLYERRRPFIAESASAGR